MVLNRIIKYLSNGIKYVRRGGITYVNVAQINYGQILRDKKVLVTGGSSGIGFAIAKKFINEGATVTIVGRDHEKLKKAQAIMNGKCLIYQWDCKEIKGIDKALTEVHDLMGGIDLIVNSAGCYIHKEFTDISISDWDTIIDTNLKALYFICQKAALYFKKQKSGKIINIASNRGLMGDYGPYGLSKAAVNRFTQGIAMKLIEDNIIVNAIAPGITATSINNIDVSSNAYMGFVPNKRICLPEEIAEIATFLASDAANNIVGQVIVCDGGFSVNYHK